MKKIMTISLSCLLCLCFGLSLASGRSANMHHAVSHARIKLPVSTVVNVNAASLSELQSLKGLGLKKSQAIINYRKQHGSFESLDSLAHVKGIGQALILRIQRKNPGRLEVGKIKKATRSRARSRSKKTSNSAD